MNFFNYTFITVIITQYSSFYTNLVKNNYNLSDLVEKSIKKCLKIIIFDCLISGNYCPNKWGNCPNKWGKKCFFT